MLHTAPRTALRARPARATEPRSLATGSGVALIRRDPFGISGAIFGEGGALEAASEAPRLAAYKAQFEKLPDSHKNGFSWKQVSARLLENPDILARALNMQGGGHLFYIAPNGTLHIKDKGVEPVMYVINTATGQMTPIFDRNAAEMKEAIEQIAQSRVNWHASNEGKMLQEGRQTLDWATGSEIEAQTRKDGYELFSHDGSYNEETYHDEFGLLMDCAAAVNEGGSFVASNNRNENRSSWLRGGLIANFRGAYDKKVYPMEKSKEERGVDHLGVVRLLRY